MMIFSMLFLVTKAGIQQVLKKITELKLLSKDKHVENFGITNELSTDF